MQADIAHLTGLEPTAFYIIGSEPYSRRLLVRASSKEAENRITTPQAWQQWQQVRQRYFPDDFGHLALYGAL